MKKKYLIIALFTILLVHSIQSLAQNWFPSEVGNEWQYLYYYSFTSASGSYLSYNLDRFYILSDTLINQTYYYKWSRYPSIWIRFDEYAQTLNLWCENEDNVIMDFNIEVDSDTILSRYICYTDFVSIIDMDFSFGDSLIYAKGFYHYDVLFWRTSFDYYSIGLGLAKERKRRDGPGGSVSVDQLSLIQARIGSNVYSHDYYPEIIIEPIVTVSDSSFELIFEVNHEYNRIFPDSLLYTSLYFIDTVYMHSYYSKGNDIFENPVILGEIISGTEMWGINTTINMDLMQDYYNFNYRIEAVDKGLFPHRSFSPDTGFYVAVYDTTTDIQEIKEPVRSFVLFQNYPNPFNPSTKLKYAISERQYTTLKVYDVLGNEITTLVNEEKPAGNYEVEFNATDLPSGVYFYQIRAGSFIRTKKMLLLR